MVVGLNVVCEICMCILLIMIKELLMDLVLYKKFWEKVVLVVVWFIIFVYC